MPNHTIDHTPPKIQVKKLRKTLCIASWSSTPPAQIKKLHIVSTGTKPIIPLTIISTSGTSVTSAIRKTSTPPPRMRTFLATDGQCCNCTADLTVRAERLTPATNIPTDTKKDMVGTNGFGTLILIKLNTHPQIIWFHSCQCWTNSLAQFANSRTTLTPAKRLITEPTMPIQVRTLYLNAPVICQKVDGVTVGFAS